jgi:signal transduction histidine kinase
MKEFSHPAQDKTLVDLNKAIQSTITVATTEWKYVADVVTDFDPDLPLVPCRPGDFNQVILNLIVNAAHAIADTITPDTGAKGTITVSTACKGDWAEVRISDTGTGMPAQVRERIFDPFFTTKEVGRGTGQGLSIAHAVITDRHGGTLRVDSEVGQGSTFVIRIPLMDGAEAA